MSGWGLKTFWIGLLTFFLTYAAFCLYGLVGYYLSTRPIEPAPVFIWGVPVGMVGALIAVVVRFSLKEPD
jgi:hypothetical protein